MLDLKVEPYLITATLEGVLAQRLVRKICPDCRERYKADPAAVALLAQQPVGVMKLERGRGCTVGWMHVHIGSKTEQCAVQDIADGLLDVLAGIGGRHDRPEDAGDVKGVRQAFQQQPDDRIELPRRECRRHQPGVDPRDSLLTGVGDPGGQHLVALHGRPIDVEDRLVPGIDLGVPGDPCPQDRPAFEVRCERAQLLGGGVQLAGHLPGEMPEDVFLAGEVLVEGHP